MQSQDELRKSQSLLTWTHCTPVFYSWVRKTVRALPVLCLKCNFDIYKDIFITWRLQTDVTEDSCDNSAWLAEVIKYIRQNGTGAHIPTTLSLNVFHRAREKGRRWRQWPSLQGVDSELSIQSFAFLFGVDKCSILTDEPRIFIWMQKIIKEIPLSHTLQVRGFWEALLMN